MYCGWIIYCYAPEYLFRHQYQFYKHLTYREFVSQHILNKYSFVCNIFSRNNREKRQRAFLGQIVEKTDESDKSAELSGRFQRGGMLFGETVEAALVGNAAIVRGD